MEIKGTSYNNPVKKFFAWKKLLIAFGKYSNLTDLLKLLTFFLLKVKKNLG